MIGKLAVAAKRYQVIHVHLPDPMANLALWCVRPATAIVVHWHSDIIQQQTALKLYQPLQRWLLDRAAVHIMASDAHDNKHRVPVLSRAREVAAKVVGAECAHALVEGNPGAVVAGRPIPFCSRPVME